MVIEKHLKDYTWSFDLERKELRISRYFISIEAGEMGGINGAAESVELDKTRMFSLFRFLIRVSQKMSSQRRKK